MNNMEHNLNTEKMAIETISYLFFAASVLLLMKNIRDYYKNTQYINSDTMGAMLNWHYGFVVLWLLGCTGVSLHPDFLWYYGLICIPLVVFATFLVWFPVHRLLKLLGLIEKEN